MIGNVCIKYITCIFIFLDDNLCKLPTNSNTKPPTILNTNLYEATTSNNIVIELLDENDSITDESMHEDDILNVNIKI